MQTEGPLRQFVEFLFSVFPLPGYLQIFDVMAAILNGIMGILGLDIKFLGL